ncbi:MAG: hypothetical protein CVU54_06550 [Deltaproteobacteria bacterium HGW-Deltaproteobacteria-12]|jgi:hypothetical protein|nr:MAG: hypothetical protein CVU54_06550 [Deltaproteobacteria bacterium HGW-Deltaproteobacteria-12]
MTERNNENKSISEKPHWHSMCWGNNTFWGILFIVVGLFRFGKKANLFPTELITIYWPLVLVIIGIWMIGKETIRRRKS